MTAEVAILNKIAVALAADSAVSIGDDAEKIYHTNKLFGLTYSRPVGIMIYDSADFLMTPLETVLKLFREHFKNPEPTIRRYLENLLGYLADKRLLHNATERRHIRDAVVTMLVDIREELRSIALQEIVNRSRFPQKPPDVVLTQIVRRRLRELQRLRAIHSLAGIPFKQVSETYKTEIQESIREVFADPMPGPNVRLLLAKLLGTFLLRGQSGHTCGIVIAGFGEEELFPRLIHIRVDGAVCGRLKYWERVDATIDRVSNTSSIFPFGQQEMVERFIEGVDREYLDWIDNTTRNFFTGFAEELIRLLATRKAVRQRLLGGLPEIVQQAIKEFSDSSERFRRTRFVHSVLDTVDFLPKEELAKMAEALVSLTSTKRRVSREKETVGGPIDVALISKGDGFVWIKRNQYFDPKLNPHFVARYYAREG